MREITSLILILLSLTACSTEFDRCVDTESEKLRKEIDDKWIHFVLDSYKTLDSHFKGKKRTQDFFEPYIVEKHSAPTYWKSYHDFLRSLAHDESFEVDPDIRAAIAFIRNFEYVRNLGSMSPVSYGLEKYEYSHLDKSESLAEIYAEFRVEERDLWLEEYQKADSHVEETVKAECNSRGLY